MYNRDPTWLSLCTPTVIRALQWPANIAKTGPLPGTAAWSFESRIGVSKSQMRSLLHPVANAAKNSTRDCIIATNRQLYTTPSFVVSANPSVSSRPSLHHPLLPSTVFLFPRVVQPQLDEAVRHQLDAFFAGEGKRTEPDGTIVRWACCAISNGEVLRSRVVEESREPMEEDAGFGEEEQAGGYGGLRSARYVKVRPNQISSLSALIF